MTDTPETFEAFLRIWIAENIGTLGGQIDATNLKYILRVKADEPWRNHLGLPLPCGGPHFLETQSDKRKGQAMMNPDPNNRALRRAGTTRRAARF
jgi:hypothetical protein